MFLVKGLLIGLIFGIPVGAVGTLTLQRTINYNGKLGFITGLGSSVADMIYVLIGVFGITIISDFLLEYQILINTLGSLFIFILGIQKIRKKTILEKEARKVGIGKIFLSSFIVGITNPTAILTFLFAFTYFDITNMNTIFDGIGVIIGVLLGTIIWWSILVFIGNKLKKNIDGKKLKLINKIFGMILIIFALSIMIKQIF